MCLLDGGFDEPAHECQVVDSIDAFREQAGGMPQLIYCARRDERYAEVLKVATAVDLDDIDRIRDLKPGEVVVQTTELRVRGYDYDTKHGDGIALLVVSSVSSDRAYKQLMGRVGRYKKPCKRFKMQTAGVNGETEAAVFDTIADKLLQGVRSKKNNAIAVGDNKAEAVEKKGHAHITEELPG